MTHDVMEFILLLLQTILLRPYVFLFFAAFLVSGKQLLGWPRTWALFGMTWATAFVSEFSSTRIGIPFGMYYYTQSTAGRELYLSNIPVMDTLSFTFLLFASYTLALWFALPSRRTREWPHIVFRFDLPSRTGWPVLILTVLFYTYIDIIIDPVALQGRRWFLGEIYGYPIPGIYFGVPISNFVGWAVVGTISMCGYVVADRRLSPLPEPGRVTVMKGVLWGCGLYYGVLAFNLLVTFWIGEFLLGTIGVLIYLPILILFSLRHRNASPNH